VPRSWGRRRLMVAASMLRKRDNRNIRTLARTPIVLFCNRLPQLNIVLY
jgi:hypothetical protein